MFYGPVRRASTDDVAVQAVGPKPKIRLDANQSWSAGDAIRIVRRLGDHDLEQYLSCLDLRCAVSVQAVEMRTYERQTWKQGSDRHRLDRGPG